MDHQTSGKKWRVYIPEVLPPLEPQMEILSAIAEVETGNAGDEADLIARASKADALLVAMKIRITRKVITSCSNLKMIAKYGVGTENIDIPTATEMGIPVFNARGNDRATAEMAIALMLASMRQIHEARMRITEGNWRQGLMGDELFGSTVGIIGYGDIAKAVIRRLLAFEVKEILVYTQTKSGEKPQDEKVKFTDLRTLLQASDVVSIHKTLTPQSKGLIGRNELGLMKGTAYLVNTSRGALVDEAALIEALQGKRIAGAGLDVFAEEPLPAGHPFLSLDNAVLTPHVGGSTRQTRRRNVTVAAGLVADFLTGKAIDPHHLVNPEVYR